MMPQRAAPTVQTRESTLQFAAPDAVKLASISYSQDDSAKALDYYLKAQRLDEKGELNFHITDPIPVGLDEHGTLQAPGD